MNKKEMAQEQISAFADGEIAEPHVSSVLAALRQPDAKADWEVYHQIGDVLRSDDMSLLMSPNFSARMAAALEKEPTIVARPEAKVFSANGNAISPATGMLPREPRRWALPGMVAAAAVAAVAFVTTPQLLVAMKNKPPIAGVSASAEAATDGAIAVARSASAAQNTVVLRDPRIDDYLLAHQRFSPSVYSTAQYARSATFENDSNK